MKNKRMVCAGLFALMAFGFYGCGSSEDTSSKTISEVSQATTGSEERELPPIGQAIIYTTLALEPYDQYLPAYTLADSSEWSVVHFDDKSEFVSGSILASDGQNYEIACVYERDPNESGKETTHLLVVGNILFTSDDTAADFLENMKTMGVDPIPYTELLEQLEQGQ